MPPDYRGRPQSPSAPIRLPRHCSLCSPPPRDALFFFFNDTATTEISTLSLHDALPICQFPHSYHIPSAGVAMTYVHTFKPNLVNEMTAGINRAHQGNSPTETKLFGASQLPLDRKSHTSELQSHLNLVCRLLLENKKCTTQHQSHLNIACRPLLDTTTQCTPQYSHQTVSTDDAYNKHVANNLVRGLMSTTYTQV